MDNNIVTARRISQVPDPVYLVWTSGTDSVTSEGLACLLGLSHHSSPGLLETCHQALPGEGFVLLPPP